MTSAEISDLFHSLLQLYIAMTVTVLFVFYWLQNYANKIVGTTLMRGY